MKPLIHGLIKGDFELPQQQSIGGVHPLPIVFYPTSALPNANDYGISRSPHKAVDEKPRKEQGPRLQRH